jgi:hypothetical protein
MTATMQKLQLCAAALALAACVSDTDDENGARRRPRPPPLTIPDAAEVLPDPMGSVACYTEGAPAATCTLPVHCCFTNYSSQHNGYCATDSCGWGTISCDGPEDCASGQQCCATKDATGWRLACSTIACAAPPSGEQLCHDASTCGDRACVNAFSVNYDLPRSLYVCR